MKEIKILNDTLVIDKNNFSNLFDIANNQPDQLEKHLISLAKQSCNSETPTTEQIKSVATILDFDLGFE